MNSKPAAKTGDPKLSDVQRWMMAVITHPDGVKEGANAQEAQRWIDVGAGNLESVVTRSRQLSASERLAIYGNAYYARLLECLGEVYPVLKRTLGDEVFDGFAFDYLQNHPSRSYTLNHLGGTFPDYLRETRPASGEEGDADWADFLIDLARLEWTIYDVFDGPGLEDQAEMALPDFQRMDPSAWLELTFQTAPCLRLLRFDYPVNDHYSQVRSSEGELTLDFPERGRHFVAISRRDFIVRRYPLSEAQFVLLHALSEGATLGEALERVLDTAGDEANPALVQDLSGWFRNWSAERCFFTSIG